MNNNFWNRVAQATALVQTEAARRVDGEGFKVYLIPNGVTRIDIDQPKEDAHEHQAG